MRALLFSYITQHASSSGSVRTALSLDVYHEELGNPMRLVTHRQYSPRYGDIRNTPH
jgi:hypothetical protein